VRQSIRGYADGVLELSGAAGQPTAGQPTAGQPTAGQPSGPRQIADELAAVKRLLDSSDDLRRVLTDSGVPATSRRAVVNELLSSRVSVPTLRLLDFTVEADRPADLVANVSWLAGRTDAAARNARPMVEQVLGHRAAEERLDGYASALLAPVDGEAALTNIEDELFRFMRIVASSEELSDTLSNRAVPQGARQGVVEDLLRGKVAGTTLRLAAYATQVGRPRDYEALLGFLVDRVASEHNRRLADVRAPVDLDESQRDHLAQALSALVGRGVDVRVTVDPTVLGGFVATIGDTVVDGSARHRLEILKERLVLTEATHTTGDS
jgi:F-type H+-transporting ATPase subunit delta